MDLANPQVASMLSAPPLQADNLPQFKKPSGGMFGGGKFGLKEALAFGLAGLVSRQNPMLLQGLLGAVMQRQKMQQEDQQYQQHRGDQFTDFQRQYDYKLAHPEPINNDTANDYDYIASKLGPAAAQQFLRSKTDPIVMTTYGPMPYSTVNPPAPKPLTDDDILRMGGQSGAGPAGGFRY
jgi:hypothetical protein